MYYDMVLFEVANKVLMGSVVSNSCYLYLCVLLP